VKSSSNIVASNVVVREIHGNAFGLSFVSDFIFSKVSITEAQAAFSVSHSTLSINHLQLTQSQNVNQYPGIYLQHSTLYLENAIISNCFATTNGSAALALTSGSVASIYKTTIHKNTASSTGAAIFVDSSSLSLSNCTVSDNTASSGAAIVLVSTTANTRASFLNAFLMKNSPRDIMCSQSGSFTTGMNATCLAVPSGTLVTGLANCPTCSGCSAGNECNFPLGTCGSSRCYNF